jgi:FMN phosphatase YigB (HAD superfamily)
VTRDAGVVFLLDVDNTLLDNDRIQQDLRAHLDHEFGSACRDQYWAILQQSWDELGYRDYLGALQRYRVAHPYDVQLLTLASWLVDYPFADRLYPRVLNVIARLCRWGQTVIVTDGDVVFQPRKVEQSGLWRAVSGHVLIYIHKEKELVDIERRYPARHYVLVDDKLWILAAFKAAWGQRVTTVLPRQGQYAHDARVLAAGPPADLTIERLGDLLVYDLPALLTGQEDGSRSAPGSHSAGEAPGGTAAEPRPPQVQHRPNEGKHEAPPNAPRRGPEPLANPVPVARGAEAGIPAHRLGLGRNGCRESP